MGCKAFLYWIEVGVRVVCDAELGVWGGDEGAKVRLLRKGIWIRY
jgi:hypothetical protein